MAIRVDGQAPDRGQRDAHGVVRSDNRRLEPTSSRRVSGYRPGGEGVDGSSAGIDRQGRTALSEQD